jgi:hypothetical protein
MSRWHSQLVAAWVGKEGSTAKNRIRYDPHTIGGYCARSWLHRKLTWILQWSELSREARLSKMADVVEGGRASLQTSMRHRERATCDHMQACRRRKHARQAPERCTFASLFLPSCPPLAPSRFEGSGWMCDPRGGGSRLSCSVVACSRRCGGRRNCAGVHHATSLGVWPALATATRLSRLCTARLREPPFVPSLPLALAHPGLHALDLWS